MEHACQVPWQSTCQDFSPCPPPQPTLPQYIILYLIPLADPCTAVMVFCVFNRHVCYLIFPAFPLNIYFLEHGMLIYKDTMFYLLDCILSCE